MMTVDHSLVTALQEDQRYVGLRGTESLSYFGLRHGASEFVVAEISDRNRSPFFRESDIHTTGCPSGNGGLAIKDPSHASTFGGFAIMASTSDIFNRRLRFL